jgi:hypothetical protein
VQPLAAWLVARPQNAILALAGTLLLPVLQIFSGIILVLLVLRHGARLAALEAAIAGAILAAVSLVVGAPVMQVVIDALVTWLPALVLAAALRSTRSLALTMQLSALIAAAAVVGFHIVVDDLTAFWEPIMTFTLEWARTNGLVEQAQVIESSPEQMAHALTVAFILWGWTKAAMFLFFGYRVALTDPGETAPFGRFCDLSFGRVLQGLAIVHWMHVDGELPLFVVIAVYVLLPFLHVFLIMGLAVVGYTDAWFGFRRRAVTKNEE